MIPEISKSMCQVGWMQGPLFITSNHGGVPSVEKVMMMLICLSSVNSLPDDKF